MASQKIHGLGLGEGGTQKEISGFLKKQIEREDDHRLGKDA